MFIKAHSHQLLISLLTKRYEPGLAPTPLTTFLAVVFQEWVALQPITSFCFLIPRESVQQKGVKNEELVEAVLAGGGTCLYAVAPPQGALLLPGHQLGQGGGGSPNGVAIRRNCLRHASHQKVDMHPFGEMYRLAWLS